MASKLTLTRDQLASFLKDHEQIKQFERLILLVQDNLASGLVAGLDDTIGNVIGAVNSVSAQVQALLDTLDRQPPVIVDQDAEVAFPPDPDLSAYDARIAGLEALPPVVPASGVPIASYAIAVGASPFTYQNTTGYNADVIVSIGTVSLVEFGRAGVFTNVGVLAGMFSLSPFDSIRVTYAVAPTMTLVTR